jgi:hypothetical protein
MEDERIALFVLGFVGGALVRLRELVKQVDRVHHDVVVFMLQQGH